MAVRTASEKGNTIVTVDDFVADSAVLYPVKVEIIGIDRYHLLHDILDTIVVRQKLSMNGLTINTKDNIVTCSIEFDVHAADELRDTIRGISSIPGIEEVNMK